MWKGLDEIQITTDKYIVPIILRKINKHNFDWILNLQDITYHSATPTFKHEIDSVLDLLPKHQVLTLNLEFIVLHFSLFLTKWSYIMPAKTIMKHIHQGSSTIYLQASPKIWFSDLVLPLTTNHNRKGRYLLPNIHYFSSTYKNANLSFLDSPKPI